MAIRLLKPPQQLINEKQQNQSLAMLPKCIPTLVDCGIRGGKNALHEGDRNRPIKTKHPSSLVDKLVSYMKVYKYVIRLNVCAMYKKKQ